jgi:hypothetical protein
VGGGEFGVDGRFGAMVADGQDDQTLRMAGAPARRLLRRDMRRIRPRLSGVRRDSIAPAPLQGNSRCLLPNRHNGKE